MQDTSREEFTPKDIARERGVSSDTVCRWIKTGKLRAYKLPSGRYRIPADELDKLVSWIEPNA